MATAREAERPSSLEIDHEFELGRLHHRQIGRLGTVENPIDVDTGLTIIVVGSMHLRTKPLRGFVMPPVAGLPPQRLL